MKFDKLVFQKKAPTDLSPRTLTVDLGSRRIAWLREGVCKEFFCPEDDWKELCALLRVPDFERWRNSYAADSPECVSWSLELFVEEKTLKRIEGLSAYPEEWFAFMKFVRACRALLKRPKKKGARRDAESAHRD